jgi:carboxynorspermidine decarboxylase
LANWLFSGTVLDIVNNGMDLVILDTSAEAHMPDTLAMPYRAMIRNSGVALKKNILID